MDGFFNTKAERAQWVGQSLTNVISFTVVHNPRGVYNWLKANYGTDFTPVYAPGFEKWQQNMDTMHDFVLAMANKAADPVKYVLNFAAAVPGKINDKTWLK